MQPPARPAAAGTALGNPLGVCSATHQLLAHARLFSLWGALSARTLPDEHGNCQRENKCAEQVSGCFRTSAPRTSCPAYAAARPSACTSVKTPALPCVPAAFAAKTLPSHCASTAFAAKIPPLPRESSSGEHEPVISISGPKSPPGLWPMGAPWLRHRLCPVLQPPPWLRHLPLPCGPPLQRC